jgi:putative ABC transport system permease protein
MLSLGLGLTLLVALGLIDHNLRTQLTQSLPKTGAELLLSRCAEPKPLSSRRCRANLRPDGQDRARADDARAGDRAQGYGGGDDQGRREGGLGAGRRPRPDLSEAVPARKVTAGSWWPKDYAGPPLVSLEAEIARRAGLNIGDRITVNVLGPR